MTDQEDLRYVVLRLCSWDSLVIETREGAVLRVTDGGESEGFLMVYADRESAEKNSDGHQVVAIEKVETTPVC